MARPQSPTPATPQKQASTPADLKSLLDRYLGCPDDDLRGELERALAAYQTGWIRERAGVPALSSTEEVKAAPRPKSPKFPISAADLDTLRRISNGWVPTTAEVPRWAWLENRELVTLEPNPTGDGSEILVLAPNGQAAIS